MAEGAKSGGTNQSIQLSESYSLEPLRLIQTRFTRKKTDQKSHSFSKFKMILLVTILKSMWWWEKTLNTLLCCKMIHCFEALFQVFDADITNYLIQIGSLEPILRIICFKSELRSVFANLLSHIRTSDRVGSQIIWQIERFVIHALKSRSKWWLANHYSGGDLILNHLF